MGRPKRSRRRRVIIVKEFYHDIEETYKLQRFLTKRDNRKYSKITNEFCNSQKICKSNGTTNDPKYSTIINEYTVTVTSGDTLPRPDHTRRARREPDILTAYPQ